MAENSCNGCTECCVAFPLLPEPGWWEEQKPAHQPCRFLHCNGCGIHDQPRPAICTEFQCGYILLDLPEAYYPRNCKVIMMLTNLKNVLQHDGWVEQFQVHTDEGHVSFVEAAPRALLALEAQKIRYHLAKRLIAPRWFSVVPYDVDLHDRADCAIRGFPAGNLLDVCDDPSISVAPQPGLMVAWKDSKEYAEEVRRWWMKS